MLLLETMHMHIDLTWQGILVATVGPSVQHLRSLHAHMRVYPPVPERECSLLVWPEHEPVCWEQLYAKPLQHLYAGFQRHTCSGPATIGNSKHTTARSTAWNSSKCNPTGCNIILSGLHS